MSGFDLGGSINSAAEWACRAPIINTIVNNAIFTAILITAIVAVIMLGTYYDRAKYGGIKQAVRSTLYVGLLVTMVMFVHHYAVQQTARDAAAHKGVRDVFSGIQASREYGAGVGTPVVPRGYDSEPATGGATESRPANVAPYGEAPGDGDGGLEIEDIPYPPPHTSAA